MQDSIGCMLKKKSLWYICDGKISNFKQLRVFDGITLTALYFNASESLYIRCICKRKHLNKVID